jgi:hypothetical protein
MFFWFQVFAFASVSEGHPKRNGCSIKCEQVFRTYPPPQGDELNPNLLLLRQFKDNLATEYSLFLQKRIHNNAKLSTRRKKKQKRKS